MFGCEGGGEVEGARLSQQIFPAFSGHRRVEQERRAVGSNARNMILSKNKKIVVFSCEDAAQQVLMSVRLSVRVTSS